MLKTRMEQVIDCSDWDDLVMETYGRPYCFQQQDDCKPRGNVYLEVPADPCDYDRETIPEKVNGAIMGVSFKAWLERDPKQKLSNPDDQNDWSVGMWWERNFYPEISMVANDLHKKGLIEAGEYTIKIDW